MNVFVSVGTQLPFDRLVKAVDAWASAHPEASVFAQVGPATILPSHIATARSVSPRVFHEKCFESDLIVAHAGIGSVLAALELDKPVIVMPRQFRLGEHRNDHQLSTVERLKDVSGINVARDVAELVRLLDNPSGLSRPDGSLSRRASSELLTTISVFVSGVRPRGAPSWPMRLLRALRP